MIYIFVCIGNTDSKLTQVEWSKFVDAMNQILQSYEIARYFFGGSETYAPLQDVSWLCMINDVQFPDIERNIRLLRETYHQDSVNVFIGKGDFV